MATRQMSPLRVAPPSFLHLPVPWRFARRASWPRVMPSFNVRSHSVLSTAAVLMHCCWQMVGPPQPIQSPHRQQVMQRVQSLPVLVGPFIGAFRLWPIPLSSEEYSAPSYRHPHGDASSWDYVFFSCRQIPRGSPGLAVMKHSRMTIDKCSSFCKDAVCPHARRRHCRARRAAELANSGTPILVCFPDFSGGLGAMVAAVLRSPACFRCRGRLDVGVHLRCFRSRLKP